MGPPRDRLAAMQQAAYFEEGDDYGVQMQEQMDGNFINIAFWINIFLNVIKTRFYQNKCYHYNEHIFDLGPMQEFFQEIEELRGIIGQIEQDIGRVRQVQNDILTCPQVDQKAKQQLEDIMNDIKKKENSGKI